ncbi:Nucleolar and coiled-body phosphoprotein 1 [Sesamum angolense]|uniref:Nucleolar and coiled-body phosphoprotein 1 n=1 Tax=Sesamum angolense TaxID=2727404 RepID=A0AAE1WER7_9LAMI|nr:Nucleolar and coiled-body phosphoprotein 1 [Sesamum angolense]
MCNLSFFSGPFRDNFAGLLQPKTVNAFQRVKVEEVEFVDERLQDNSYWAKDGADIGYGAKAQEVLGQVKGRDFRHEKTKKKRGSYRGGQIDLQSHSVKFNYSDDE